MISHYNIIIYYMSRNTIATAESNALSILKSTVEKIDHSNFNISGNLIIMLVHHISSGQSVDLYM